VFDISSWRGMKIFFDVRVGKSAIVQVDTQLLDGNGAARKQGADRFKNDLMLWLDESVIGERLHEPLPKLASDGHIAKHAEGLEFGCGLCFAIH
jgi:hypothetical protein